MNTEKTDLIKKVQDLTECSICTDVLNDPRILPCIHSFCLKCLQQAGEQSNLRPGEKMPCPICREEFIIPKLGWNVLKRNFFIQRLVEMSQSSTRTENKILCDVCTLNREFEVDTEIPFASVYCVDCKDNLCDRCHGEHKRQKLSKGHQIATKCQMKQEQDNCEEHEKEYLAKYCVTCKKLICNTCSAEVHESHSCSDVERFAAGFSNEINEYIKETDKFVKELTGKSTELQQEKEMFLKARTAREIETAKETKGLTANDKKTILEENASIKHEMEKQYSIEKDAIERNMVIVDSFRMYCNKIIAEGFPCDICRSVDEIRSRAKVLQQLMNTLNRNKCRQTPKKNGSQNDGLGRTKPFTQCHFDEQELSSKRILSTLVNQNVAELLMDRNYMKLQAVVERSAVNGESYQAFWNRVLPYIIQQVKMWNGHVLYPQNLSSLMSIKPKPKGRKFILSAPSFSFELGDLEGSDSKVDVSSVLIEPTSTETSNLPCETKLAPSDADPLDERDNTSHWSPAEGDVQENFNSFVLDHPVSRLDFVAYIVNFADCFVALDIFRIISKFPMTLPFILPDISQSDKYIVTLPYLKNLTLKWESSPGNIIENHLFSSSFRMVVAIRLGTGEMGKSVILNQLMAKQYMFSSCTEPGHKFGRPLTLDGTVEIVSLTQETCSDTTWKKVHEYYKAHDEVAILANLHGDAMKYPDTMQYLRRFAGAFIVFLMPNATEQQWKYLSRIESEKCILPVRVVEKQKKGCASELPLIETSAFLSDETHDVVRTLLLHALDKCGDGSNQSDTSSVPTSLRYASNFRTRESERVIEFVRKHGCSQIKEIINTICSNDKNKWIKDNEQKTLVDLTLNIFKQQDVATSKKSLTNLEIELSKISAAESLTGRSRVIEANENLRRMVKFHKASGDNKEYMKFQSRLKEAQRKLRSALDEVDNITLGQEHFFRLLGHIFEGWSSGRLSCGHTIIRNLPDQYADLLIGGHAIELLNGDSGLIQLTWIRAICRSVQQMMPKLKVFVLSIIGLQSSGKSTLLNALFSCRFAVSVGRCSRGLFMRMIFLDEEVRKAHDFDAIIVIDTEGLCSPEKMNDPKSDQKDRLMATYAIGVSNLTIVNILGEGLTEMTEILQIAVIAMARLREGGIKPDIIMVQHLQERNTNKIEQAKTQFCDALNRAFELINKNNVEIGTNCSECLDELISRIQSGDLFQHFGPFKDGSSVNSPPSETYHEEIVNLYKKILERTNSLENKITFARWSQLFESYWACVTKENFALNFKNVKQITEFLYFEKRVAKVKEQLSSAFRFHRESLSKEIREKVSSKITGKRIIETEALCDEVLALMREKLEQIPTTCSENRCKGCKDFVTSHEELLNELKDTAWEKDTKRTIEKHKAVLKESTTQMLKQTFHGSVVRQGCFSEFSDLISKELKQVLSDKPTGNFSPEEKKEIEERIWMRLKDIATSKDSGEDLQTKFSHALKQEYKKCLPVVIEKFEKDINLEHRKKSKSSVFGIFRRIFSEPPHEEPDLIAVGHAFEDFVKKFLKDKKFDCYQNGLEFEEGMVSEIRAKFPTEMKRQEEEIKRKFPHKKISETKKIELQIFTLQQLKKELDKCQKLWNRENKPIEILMQKEQSYRNEIETRLNSGFSSAGEGEIQALRLIEAIKQKALKAGYEAKVQTIKDLSWTTDSQSVRLQYFETLALEVADKNKERALNHFESPKKAIEEWYQTTVDSWPTKAHALKKYEMVLKGELERVLQEIRVSENRMDVEETMKQHLKTNDDQYFSKLDTKDDDFESFRNSFERNLEKYSRSNLIEKVTFAEVSGDPEIIARLGCTEHCFWCGALCWGSSGHKVGNDDNLEIEKHHSCHQPRGLVGTNNIISKELISLPCHNTTDDTLHYFREYQGISWAVAKREHFKDWKFAPHYVTRFQEMMRWFFQELHRDIACQRGLLPAPAGDLAENGCVNLELDGILETVRGWK